MAAVIFFTLWIATVFTVGRACPELCTCSDKYGVHFVDCAYRDFAEIPNTLPPNAMSVSLSANRIRLVPLGSFDNVTQVMSLWMSHNKIASVEEGTLAPLIHLRNFDISYNEIVNFPWEDLRTLTGLQLLKMNHNKMANLPRDAFANLKELKSLRLNDNRIVTITEGTFDGLISLSHLQIFKNPFACTCSLDWLRTWILTTTVSVSEQDSIVCATPENLKDKVISKLPESKCASPNVTIRTEPNALSMNLYEDSTLVLTCEFKGNPNPVVTWNIYSKIHKLELALSSAEDNSAESSEDSSLANNNIKIYDNGTLIISHLRKDDSGNYSCSASNEFGKAEDLVSVEVFASPKPTEEVTETPIYAKTQPIQHQTTKTSMLDPVNLLELNSEEILNVPTSLPAAETDAESTSPSRGGKCGLTASSQYISSHASNRSMEDIKQYTFDFGVLALGVSESEATVRLNPLLIPKEKSTNQDASSGEDPEDPVSGNVHLNGLYLCETADRKHSAVQWSRIQDGVNMYQFSSLRPGTNYLLCLTYRGEDCEVQVLFATRRRVPNLLIIISVSICLLTVSTMPLLGAMCFHLVYKYRSKTYKLILKAKGQYHMERSFNIHAPHTESQKNINGNQLDEEKEEEEEEEEESSNKEADTEESVVTESFTLSQYRENLDDCEDGSEYSDRLPLGAEAVNIKQL
ncbi:hypothetical protein LDENG_00117750 [Lucifuga dentata]|nr:hypothetical protein LDENG_00117750 [Lucifuga dentata]